MLEALLQPQLGDLRGPQANWPRAAQRVFHLALGGLALPGLLLGVAYAFSQPRLVGLGGALGLLTLAALLGGVAVRLARQTDPAQKPLEALLTRAIQLASAPGVAFLLGCTALAQWPLAGALWLLALGFYAYCRTQLAASTPITQQQELEQFSE